MMCGWTERGSALAYVRQLSSRKWQAVYRDPAGRQRSRTFPTKAAARPCVGEQENAVRPGAYIDQERGQRLFRDVTNEWRETRVVEATTRAAADGRLGLHGIPHFGEMARAAITPMHVRH